MTFNQIQKTMSVLETTRLILRKFKPGDSEFIYKLVNSLGWLKYMKPRGISGLEEAQKYIETLLIPPYEKYGFGLYMMVRKDDGVCVGMCGLIKRDTMEDVDIGFAVLPEYEGNGYASEAAIATMDHADQLGLKKIVAITVEYNTGSIKILEKLGMKFEKTIRLPDDPEDLMLYVKEL